MDQYYCPRIKYLLFLLFSFIALTQGFSQSYTETFDDSDPTHVSTLNRTIGGVPFDFVFTNDGDGGDFVLYPEYGVDNSPSLDIRSSDLNESTIERITISRSDGQLFEFTSLFLRNFEADDVTIQGFRSGSSVGSPQIVLGGLFGNYDFDIIVDEVQLTSMDFFNVNLDDFTWSMVSNTAPIATSPSVPIVAEDESNVELADDIHITDSDGDDQTVTFTITGGTLTMGTSGITFGGSGNGSDNFIASGTLANMNVALDAATFTPTPNLYGSNAATISFVSNDGGGDSNEASVTFDITGVNDDPTLIGLPSQISITEDAQVENPISEFDISDAHVDDVDLGAGELTMSLRADGGVFSLAAPGDSFTLGGNGTSRITITGTLAQVNGYIDQPTNIYYLPERNLSGDNATSIEVYINDNGNTGAGGGNDIFAGSININIAPVNDAPEVTLPATIDVIEDSNTALTGISFVDVDAGSENVTVVMSVGAGTITAVSGGGVTITGGGTSITFQGTIADINAFIADSNLTYQNESGNTADQTLTVSVNDNGNTGSGGSLSDNATTTIAISSNPAEVTSVALPVDGTYGGGENLDFVVNFDEDVIVETSGGTPRLSTTIGASTRYATYISGSGSSILVFRYTVEPGDEDSDGLTLSPTIDTNGGTIQNDGIDANRILQNIGSAAGILVDAVAPSGYSVAIDQALINATNELAVSFSISGAEVGADYIYSFYGGSGGTPVIGAGRIDTATDQILGIDLSGLNDGPITLSVTLTDSMGNVGSAANATALKDTTAPSGYAVSIDQDPIDGSNQSLVSFTFTGAEVGAFYNYSFTGETAGSSITGSGTVTAANQQVSGIDLSTLAAGTVTLSTSLEDLAGNTGVSVTDTSIKETNNNPTTLNVTVDAGQSKMYGEADPIFTYTESGFENGDDESILSGALSRVAGEEVGIYTIELGTLDAGANYNIVFASADFSITPATLDVTVDAGQSKLYGEADPVFTYTASGFESGDDESILSGALSRVAGEEVGTYMIEQGTLSAGANYNINFTSTDFNITPATLDITVDAGQSKLYGEADPVFTYTASGFESGDDESILSGALGRVAGEEVGTYAIEQGTLSAGSNYNINFTSTDFNITPVTLDITVDAGQSKTYGQADPVFTYTASGFENGDDESILSGILSRVVGEEVGTYVIEQGTLSAGSNYNINFTSADFSVTTAILDITVDAGQSKTYGQADPVFTYTVTGFESGHDESILSGILSRVAGEEVGTYAIEQGTLSAGSGYTINFSNADFAIEPAILNITADTSSKTYGDSDPEFTYQVSGFVKGDDIAIVTGALSRATGEDVGNYAITLGSLSGGTNYELHLETADFEILKADQEITWDQDLSFGCDSDSQRSLTASASSGLPVTYTVTDTSIAEVTGDVLFANASGSTTIIAQQPGDENHHPATSVEKVVSVSQNGLIRQHWDDVLVFDNSSGDFVSYQWYKDGAAVGGATKQYYSENGTLSGSYYAEATTQSGEVIISCVLELSGEHFTKSVRLVPNPAPASSEFVVDCSFDEATLSGASISVIDLNGRLMQTVSVTGSQTSLTAPTQRGVYVVVLSLSDGTRKTVNLLVN